MNASVNSFVTLAAIDVTKHVEKKGELKYLSWPWAIDQLLRHDPLANWTYGEPIRWGETLMVVCTVTAFGVPRTMQLPVMDHRNKAIANPDAFQVNTAMQRCLVKAIALHGLGLYIYAGEDLPPAENGDPQKAGYAAADEITLQELRDAAMNGMAALSTAWKHLPEPVRKRLHEEVPKLKAAASEADALKEPA